MKTIFDKSQSMALKLGNAAQALFCTFEVSPKDGGLIKKPIQRGGKPGVPAVISDEALFTAAEIYGMEAIEHGQYFGLNMNTPLYVEGKGYLVCLDVDMKRRPKGDPPHSAIKSLESWVNKVGALNELSVSGKGHHIFVFAKTAYNILRKYPLVQGQEIEVFGLDSSDKKSILLTGEAIEGEVVEVDDLEALFIELGIAQKRVAPAPVPPPAAEPRANLETFKAPLQAAAGQYVNDPQVARDKAVEALKFISADSDYAQWIKVGQALHDGFGEQGRALWGNWSQRGDKYKNQGDIDTHWKSFHQGGGVGIGTLFHLAEKGGYKHPSVSRQSAQADFSAARVDPETGEVLPPAPYEWPEPQPIPDDLPPVPAFDLGLLPASLRPWIADIAERMQISPDLPAIGAITALSAAIGRRVQIMPKAHDDWTVIPNLWGVVVAPPGYMKSPALSEVMKPLHRLEAEAFKEHEAKMLEWSQEMVRASILRAATKSATLKSLKSNPRAKIDIAAGDPNIPVAKRFIVNNFSQEALGEVLLGNPDGVLAFSDEIHGLLMMAHKPGNEGLNDFLLSAWNGDGGHTFDRIGRGVRRVERCCVAVLGGIQPGRITEYVIGATSGGAGDSGLLQRFQLLTWPDIRPEWQLVDRLPDREAGETVNRVFDRLAKMVTPADVFGNKEEDIRRFDEQAQAAFFAWLAKLEAELRGHDLPPVMASHLSKYRSLVPSLALVFAVADGVTGSIPLQYVEQAIGWADYLRPHAERAYACALRPETRQARALLDKIKAGAVTGKFKLKDVYWNGWSQLDTKGAAKAVDVLCDLDYLLREEVRNPSGGRPSVSFHINPKSLN